MGKLSDTSIVDWSVNTNSNLPTDSTPIGRNLAGQWRNMKSVAREQSLDKQFQRTGTIATTIAGGASASAMPLAGDVTADLVARRKLRLVATDAASTVYAGILNSTYSGGTDVTTVLFAPLDGIAVTGGTYYVDLGTELPNKGSLPPLFQSGTVTITGGNTNATTANFARTEADKAYFVKATVTSTNSGQAGAILVSTIVKGTANMTIGLNADPGGTNATVIGYTIFRTTA